MQPTCNQASAAKTRKRPADEASALALNTKKARTDDENTIAGREDATKLSSGKFNGVKKHTGKSYYEDGNVVLISEDVAFRVHRMFLASRSEIFKIMFDHATHRTPEDGEFFDGCPVIHVKDNFDDLTVFLEAFYGHIDIGDIEPDFPKFAAVLRLSEIYMVKILSSSCIRHLSLKKVPTTLGAYDIYHPSERDGSHFCYYNLIYEVAATRLLPASFYIMSTIKTSSIHETSLYLPGDAMLRLYQGKTELFRRYSRILGLLKYQARKCYTTECQQTKMALIEAKSVCLAEQPGILDSLDPLRFLCDLRDKCDMLECSICVLDMRRRLGDARQEIWDALPRIFKFGDSWDDLESH